jgi:hypothetical protein
MNTAEKIAHELKMAAWYDEQAEHYQARGNKAMADAYRVKAQQAREAAAEQAA